MASVPRPTARSAKPMGGRRRSDPIEKRVALRQVFIDMLGGQRIPRNRLSCLYDAWLVRCTYLTEVIRSAPTDTSHADIDHPSANDIPVTNRSIIRFPRETSSFPRDSDAL